MSLSFHGPEPISRMIKILPIPNGYPAREVIDRDIFRHADFLVHLAGANVADHRWTKKRKKELVDSRVQSGAFLSKTLRENHNNIKAVISASAIGYYGEDPVIPNPSPFVETDPASADFLGEAGQPVGIIHSSCYFTEQAAGCIAHRNCAEPRWRRLPGI